MSQVDAPRSMAIRGAIYGLAAAALFGLSAPVSKRLLGHLSPQLLAGLLYLGAGLGLTVWRRLRPPSDEAPIQRQDLPSLIGLVVIGGVLAPVLMLVGLGRVSGVVGSLLLNLEAPFTIGLAVVLGEHLGRRGAAAAVCILIGAGLLKFQPGGVGADAWGVAALAAACLCWAIDNNLTQRLSLRDPFAVVRIKTLGAGTVNLVLAMLLGASWPSWSVLAAALVMGCLSYGVSVVLDAFALRWIGAAREAAYFATAPFVGAIGSAVILGDRLQWIDALAMGAMASGVVLLLRERHGHVHRHVPLDHEHVHTHDEHHRHVHGPGDPAGDKHSHAHHHDPLEHAHDHVPDVHHRHTHAQEQDPEQVAAHEATHGHTHAQEQDAPGGEHGG